MRPAGGRPWAWSPCDSRVRTLPHTHTTHTTRTTHHTRVRQPSPDTPHHTTSQATDPHHDAVPSSFRSFSSFTFTFRFLGFPLCFVFAACSGRSSKLPAIYSRYIIIDPTFAPPFIYRITPYLALCHRTVRCAVGRCISDRARSSAPGRKSPAPPLTATNAMWRPVAAPCRTTAKPTSFSICGNAGATCGNMKMQTVSEGK